jgi:hypothetical protein
MWQKYLSENNMTSVSWFKKINGDTASLSKEITAAVVLKFILLAGLWWLFFKGHKQPVDGDIIAAKLFGEDRPSLIQLQKSPERP